MHFPLSHVCMAPYQYAFENGGRRKHREQAKTQASDENLRDRNKGYIEEAKNRSVSHLRRRQDVFWSILQGVLSQPTPQLMVTQKMAMWRWGGVRSHRGAASPIPAHFGA